MTIYLLIGLIFLSGCATTEKIVWWRDYQCGQDVTISIPNSIEATEVYSWVCYKDKCSDRESCKSIVVRTPKGMKNYGDGIKVKGLSQ